MSPCLGGLTRHSLVWLGVLVNHPLRVGVECKCAPDFERRLVVLCGCCCCAAGRIGPEYVSSELNIGGSVVSSALCEVCGVSRSQLREMYKQHGDLGDVAQVRTLRQ